MNLAFGGGALRCALRKRNESGPRHADGEPSPSPGPTGLVKAGNIPCSVPLLFFLQIASPRAPLECGGLPSWLSGFQRQPHLRRLPGWAWPTAGQAAGIWQAARPSAVTTTSHPPRDRTGQVGRSQRPHSKLGCLGVPAGNRGGHCKQKAPGKC